MKYLHLACVSLTTLAAGYAAAQTATYDTITGYENSKWAPYVYTNAYVFGDLMTPRFSRPVSKIEVVYFSTLTRSGRFNIRAALWAGGSFQNRIDYVDGTFIIPAAANPSVGETWLLTYSPVNIALTPLSRVYGLSFEHLPSIGLPDPGTFTPLFANNATQVGTDYAGFSIDTNRNGILEPNLPFPNQEWYNPWPTSAHGNLVCALYEMSQNMAADSAPQFTASKIDLGAYRLQALAKAADPLNHLR